MTQDHYTAMLLGSGRIGAGTPIDVGYNPDGSPLVRVEHDGHAYELVGTDDAAEHIFAYRLVG